MFHLGSILIVLGIVILFIGHQDSSAVRMTYYAIEGMGSIIVGSIFIAATSIINSIYELMSGNNINIRNEVYGGAVEYDIKSNKAHSDCVEYVVVFNNDNEQKVLAKKNSKWDDIVGMIKDQSKDLLVRYIIDEDGRKVFKGGYLG